MPEKREAEAEVFSAFQSGEPGAIATVRAWVGQVVMHPGWRFGDPESVIQDILLKLLDIARSGRFHGMSSFRTFATSVARNTCIDAWRRQRWRERIEISGASGETRALVGDDPEEAHHMEERRELLRYVFQRLPEECRRLWIWIYGQGLAARQVANELGISEANVRVRAHRCLQKARGIARDFLAQEV